MASQSVGSSSGVNSYGSGNPSTPTKKLILKVNIKDALRNSRAKRKKGTSLKSRDVTVETRRKKIEELRTPGTPDPRQNANQIRLAAYHTLKGPNGQPLVPISDSVHSVTPENRSSSNRRETRSMRRATSESSVSKMPPNRPRENIIDAFKKRNPELANKIEFVPDNASQTYYKLSVSPISITNNLEFQVEQPGKFNTLTASSAKQVTEFANNIFTNLGEAETIQDRITELSGQILTAKNEIRALKATLSKLEAESKRLQAMRAELTKPVMIVVKGYEPPFDK